MYRGESVVIPPQDGDFNAAAASGWVDLRPQNTAVWISRAQRMVEQASNRDRGSDSGADWGALEPDGPIAPPKFTTWVFQYEDGGERIKR